LSLLSRRGGKFALDGKLREYSCSGPGEGLRVAQPENLTERNQV